MSTVRPASERIFELSNLYQGTQSLKFAPLPGPQQNRVAEADDGVRSQDVLAALINNVRKQQAGQPDRYNERVLEYLREAFIELELQSAEHMLRHAQEMTGKPIEELALSEEGGVLGLTETMFSGDGATKSNARLAS